MHDKENSPHFANSSHGRSEVLLPDKSAHVALRSRLVQAQSDLEDQRRLNEFQVKAHEQLDEESQRYEANLRKEVGELKEKLEAAVARAPVDVGEYEDKLELMEDEAEVLKDRVRDLEARLAAKERMLEITVANQDTLEAMCKEMEVFLQHEEAKYQVVDDKQITLKAEVYALSGSNLALVAEIAELKKAMAKKAAQRRVSHAGSPRRGSRVFITPKQTGCIMGISPPQQNAFWNGATFVNNAAVDLSVDSVANDSFRYCQQRHDQSFSESFYQCPDWFYQGPQMAQANATRGYGRGMTSESFSRMSTSFYKEPRFSDFGVKR